MAVWLILVHASALLLLPLLPSPLWLKLSIACAVLLSLVDSWRRQAQRSHPDAVRTVIWDVAGLCQLTLESGQQQAISLASQAFIQPWMVVVHFKSPRRRFRYLLLLPDMLDEEAFRQLRVRLRIAMDQGAA